METTMNNQTPNFNNFDVQQSMTSMDIAEITGKRHKDVLKAIRTMEPAWEKEQGRKFALLQRYTSAGNGAMKLNPYYELTKTECLYVATKFNDQARAKLVLRWEQLERERLCRQPQPTASATAGSNLPADPSQLTRKQLLLMALEAEEENERLKAEKEELEADNYGLMIENGEKDRQIESMKQRISYLDLIDRSKNTLNTTQIAQDYGMSALAFNQLLKGLHIQYNSGGQWILYAQFLNKGYVANRQLEIIHSNKYRSYKQLTVWTNAGRHFLYNELKKKGILPLIERIQDEQKGGAA